MSSLVYVFDPTKKDILSAVRGIGRYLQIFKENFPNWTFTDSLPADHHSLPVFINSFFNFLAYPLLMKRVAKKQVAVIHDLIPLKYPSHFPIGVKGNINVFLNKLALKNYDLIVTDSETSKKDIVRMLKIKPEKVKVIYPCLPNVFTNPKFEYRNPKQTQNSNDKSPKRFENFNLKHSDLLRVSDLEIRNYCLYVGDATWNKNLVNIAKAIKIADVTCVFVGKVFEIFKNNATGGTGGKAPDSVERSEPWREGNPGQNLSRLRHPWQKEFHEFIKEIKNDERFKLSGFIPDKELIKLYQQARLNILVSRDEGFGFSYVEAANFGCPSVLSDTPVLKELAGDDNALFASPDSPSDIASKIKQIYFNDELRSELGLRAQQRAKVFNETQFKKSFLEVLNS